MARLIARSTLGSACLLAVFAVAAHSQTAAKAPAQTAPPKAQAPAPRPPARTPARPPARTTPAPAPAPAAAKAEPAPPPKPVAQDLRMKTVYTAGPQKTESVTYQKGARERFEFGDTVVLKQHDLKRTVQIIRAANTYMLVPDGASPIPVTAPAPNTAPAKPGVITMATTITDTGERKMVFGNMQARHVKTTIDKQPSAGACDTSKQHIETDGWYIDLPTPPPAMQDVAAPAPPVETCVDEVKATQAGDPKALGFPVSYSTTIVGEDGKPNVVAMEVTELEVTTLDAALFEIPAGMMEAGNIRALSQAVSDANETKLAQELTAPTPPVQKTAGVPLIGVQEVVNKTSQQVDTRTLRSRLVTELAASQIQAAPLAGSQADLLQVATSHGYDYLLVAEITDLKVSKPGGLGGVLKAATKVAGGGGATQDPTEATVSIKLVQPDGKPKLASNVKGKDGGGGGGFDLKSGLGVAKFAGTMYMNMMTGKLMMNALNQSMAGNLSGIGMLGNPAMTKMQTQGLGMPMQGVGMQGMRMGIDPTASAASFLMQQAMASTAAMAGGAGGQGGPSFDAALGDAFEQAAKAISENLKKGAADPKKK